jgi:dolichol-phosphate mannosyltransferase
MLAYTKEKILRLIEIDFIRFCIVGGSGFVINLALLFLLHGVLHINVFVSQVLAAELALLSNFMLHHYWTYKRHHVVKSVRTLLWQFHASSWPAVFGSAALVSLGEKILGFDDLLALMFSSVVVLAWNFGWSKYVIWRDVSEKDVAKMVQ